MDTSFDPRAVEPKWRALWEAQKVGTPPEHRGASTFTIALPPPNVTGVLHCGHAAGSSVQDILIRYHKMLGDDIEWTPGTDHAAIATQNVIERQLAAEGSSKEELGREAFAARVDAWYEEYGGRILEQMRRLGFICDWSRTRFTLDAPYVRAIRIVFKELFEQGFIYRGPRIVNWCTRCRSAISDEEVVWEVHDDAFYYLEYPVVGGGSLTIATVRPETMLGDSAVAISPGDPRYAGLAGKKVRLPLTGREIPIIEDAKVEREFGTGALKVTPAHDPLDYEIGARHGLEVLSVIAPDGTIDYPDLPELHGLDITAAREAIVTILADQHVLVKQEPYTHDVGHCERCGNVIEPLISEQWWMAMKELAKPAIDDVNEGRVTFHPRRYTDEYMRWILNIREWCISRQLWLGHEIPVSTCGNGHVFAWVEPPDTCPECGSSELTQDPDVLDTWFSSALWPFAIYGWPETTDDLARFYPTDMVVTAREIIFLWIARMMMMGRRFMNEIPFSHVVITGTIQAADGSRMSKSKGNVVDPLAMVEQYGADAVRAWAASVGTSGQDVRFDENKIASYQRFVNKLWQASRFLSRLAPDGGTTLVVPQTRPGKLALEDRWILQRTQAAIDTVTSAFHSFRFLDAIDCLYDLIWHEYCDWYVEIIKHRLPMHPANETSLTDDERAASWTAVTVMTTLLELLHPIMPFVTEECKEQIPGMPETLLEARWPKEARATLASGENHTATMDQVIDAVQQIRNAAQLAKISPQAGMGIAVHRFPDKIGKDDVQRLLSLLVRIPAERVVFDEATQEGGHLVVASGFEVDVISEGRADAPASAARLEKQLADKRNQIARIEQQLANPGFLAKAPAAIVEQSRATLSTLKNEVSRMEDHHANGS